jgi:hypothetical protein
MLKQVNTIKCTHVIAQVALGYYDAEGNLIGEEMFPQAGGNVIVAKLFYPHTAELSSLITACVQQAWEKLSAQGQAERQASERDGAEKAGAERDGSEPEGGRTRTPG